MKKLFVLTLALVLTLGTAAMAANVTIGGTLEATYEFSLNNSDVVPDPATVGFTAAELSLSAGEEGLWDATAVVAIENPIEDWELALGKYHFQLLPEMFVVDVWGNGYGLSDKADFFGFITSADEPDAPKVRVATDALGFSLTADYDADKETFYAFGEGTVEGLTIGGAFSNKLQADEDARTVAGYLTYPVDIVTLTVGGGYDLSAEEGGYAVKGVVDVTEEVTLTAQYGKDLTLTGAGNEYYVQADYVTANIDAQGKYAVDPEDETTISGEVAYRQDGTVDFGDLFDDYNLLTGYAAKAFASSTTTAAAADNATLTLKGYAAAPLADNVWAKADVGYTADKDNTLEYVWTDESGSEPVDVTEYYESKLTANAALFIQLTEKLSNESKVGYVSYKELGTELDLSTKFNYVLSGSASLWAELARSNDDMPAGEEVDTTATFGFKVSF